MQFGGNKNTRDDWGKLKNKSPFPSLTLWVSPTKKISFKTKSLGKANDDDCPRLAVTKASLFLFGTN